MPQTTTKPDTTKSKTRGRRRNSKAKAAKPAAPARKTRRNSVPDFSYEIDEPNGEIVVRIPYDPNARPELSKSERNYILGKADGYAPESEDATTHVDGVPTSASLKFWLLADKETVDQAAAG